MAEYDPHEKYHAWYCPICGNTNCTDYTGLSIERMEYFNERMIQLTEEESQCYTTSRKKVFALLGKIRKDFISETNRKSILDNNGINDFEKYCKDSCGIILGKSDAYEGIGGYDGSYTIINESKYNLTLIKYG